MIKECYSAIFGGHRSAFLTSGATFPNTCRRAKKAWQRDDVCAYGFALLRLYTHVPPHKVRFSCLMRTRKKRVTSRAEAPPSSPVT
jgi:hypothetical protein